MNFSDTFRGIESSPGISKLQITEDCLQGHSCFGGLQAALAVHAMRTLVDASLPLRSLQMTFLAPVPPSLIEARAQVLRTGKSATHVAAQLLLDGAVLAVLVGVFGSARQSAVSGTPAQRKRESHASTALGASSTGQAPSFMQHFDLRWSRGSQPFSGETLDDMVVMISLRESGPITEGHVITIADVIPPVALSKFTHPVAGSSMTWMLELLRHDFEQMDLTGWRVEAEMDAAMDGYTSQSARIFAPDGAPVAISRQSMVVFG